MDTHDIEVGTRVLEAKVFIPGVSRERIWELLTDAAELRQWFAQDAEVLSPARAGEPARYDFWGIHTPGSPARAVVNNPVLACEVGEHFRYGWRMLGMPVEIDYLLSEVQRDGVTGTELRVRHFGVRPWKSPQPSVTDFWLLSLENLRLHALGQGGIVRADFSLVSSRIDLTLQVAARPGQVLAALLDPQTLDRWWTTKAVIEPQVGGKYDYGWGGDEGPLKILELEQPGAADEHGKLAIEWNEIEHDPAVDFTVVSWELEGSEGGTRITLAHSGFIANRQDYRAGWLGFLVTLRSILELGSAWSKVETNGYNVEEVEA